MALYDPHSETVVSADASAYGLGAVLIQCQWDGNCRPVAYASRAMTNTEQMYAQIDKEALALTWACERFSGYMIGKHFHLQTDHKPLVPLLRSKHLDELPVRVQRFRMRFMRFTYSIVHVPGKDLCIADTLSRAPLLTSSFNEAYHHQEVEMFVNFVVKNLPATERRLSQIMKAQESDEICKQIKMFCQKGWPHHSQIKGTIMKYSPVSTELSIQGGLLMWGSRIVIPPTLLQEILNRLHTGHQGITKCRERARHAVWWPGLNSELEDLIQKCPLCCKERFQQAEPLIPSTFPQLPWQKVGADLCCWKGSTYLLLVDCFSRYIEIAKLVRETSGRLREL